MKNRPGPDRLLDDLVGDAVPSHLRVEWLERTLTEVRRRNRARRTRSGAVAMTISLGLFLVLWKMVDPHQNLHSHYSELRIVESSPLKPSEIVETRIGTVSLINTSTRDISVVTTRTVQGTVALIDDQQLLNLVAGRSAALVRSESGQSELIFADPADASGFPLQ
jgi:hypothetical protein